MALRVSEICFWLAKSTKNLNFLRCLHVFDLLLKYCSDKNEGNWLQLLFLLACSDGYSCLGYWKEFLSSVFWVLDWNFLVLHFCGNVCNWIRKLIWSQMDWFLFFCCYMPRFVDFISAWTKICKNCWNVVPLWRYQIFWFVWGVFLSVL